MKRLLRFKFYPRSGLNVRAGIIHGESFAELIPQVKEIMYSESMPYGKYFVFKDDYRSGQFEIASEVSKFRSRSGRPMAFSMVFRHYAMLRQAGCYDPDLSIAEIDEKYHKFLNNKKNKKDIEEYRIDNTHLTITHTPICELFLKWVDKFGTEEDLIVLDKFLGSHGFYSPTRQFEEGIRNRLHDLNLKKKEQSA